MKNYLIVIFVFIAFYCEAQKKNVFSYYPSFTEQVFSLKCDGDTLWVGAHYNIVKMLNTGEILETIWLWDYYAWKATEIEVSNTGTVWFSLKGKTNTILSYKGGEKILHTNALIDSIGDVLGMSMDRNNKLWVSGKNGTVTFNDSIWEYYNINLGGSFVFDSINQLWSGYKGLSVLKNMQWDSVGIGGDVVIDSNGNIWIYSDASLYKYSRDTFEYYTSIYKKNSFIIDSKNNFWFVFDDGITCYNTNTQKKTNISFENNIYEKKNIVFDKYDNLYIGGVGYLSILKYKDGDWQKMRISKTLEGRYSDYMLSDYDGNLFVTSGSLFAKLYDIATMTYDTIDVSVPKIFDIGYNNEILYEKNNNFYLYKNEVLYLIPYKGEANLYGGKFDSFNNIWFGNSESVVVYNGTNWVEFEELKERNKGVGSIDIDQDGTVWACGYDINYYDGISWHTFHDNTLNWGISYEIMIDANGNKWFRKGDEISVYDGVEWYTPPFFKGNSSLRFFEMADSEGNIWFSNLRDSVFKCNVNECTVYTKEDGLKTLDFIFSVAINKNDEIVILTDVGFFILNDGTKVKRVRPNCLNGYVFYDENANGIKESSEILLPRQYLSIDELNKSFTTWDIGDFSFSIKNGTYTLRTQLFENWIPTTPDSIKIHVQNGDVDKDLTFGLKLKENSPDLNIDIVGGPTRAFFNTRYWINIENRGYTATGINVVLHKSELLYYKYSSIAPSEITDSTIIWHFDSMNIFETEQIVIDFDVAGVENLGDEIVNNISISSKETDLNIEDNTFSLNQIITGSYDPNDKKEHTGIKEEGYTLFDSQLNYTIRFQNTGTDTAFNIKIIDTLDPKLDVKTLRILSSSHDYIYNINEEGILGFRFNNILLPDSTHNETESHGYIKYSIKPLSNLEENTKVKNTAYIYFDYNPAIVTNTTVNTFVSVLPFEHIENALEELIIQPNPSCTYLRIVHLINSPYKIFDSSGKTVLIGYYTNQPINISKLSKGVYLVKVNDKSAMFVKECAEE